MILAVAVLLAQATAEPPPCGYVDFEPNKPMQVLRTGQVRENITLVIHLPDGRAVMTKLDYPFVFPGVKQDPFLKGNGNVPAVFQFPPAEKRGQEPSIVQYVMAHTTPDGYTYLAQCPSK